MHLAEFNGGNLRNAIAREALCGGGDASLSQRKSLIVEWNVFASEMEFEYRALGTQAQFTTPIC